MTAAESGSAHLLLPLAVALAERQRGYAAEVLHDGPMQEFTAVLLGLGQLRDRLDAEHANRLSELETRLRDTVTALRSPPSAWRTDLAPPALLDAALRSWVKGPLAENLCVTVDGGTALDRRDVAAVVGLVQFVLHELDPAAAASTADVEVVGRLDTVDVTIRAVPAASAVETKAGGLSDLAAALGAQASQENDDDGWTFRARLPRQSASVPATQRRRRVRDRLRRRVR